MNISFEEINFWLTIPFYGYAGIYLILLIGFLFLEWLSKIHSTTALEWMGWPQLAVFGFILFGFPWFLCSLAGILISPILGTITAILVFLYYKSKGI